MSPEGQHQDDAEIEGILSDLDAILSGAVPSPEPSAPAESLPVQPPTIPAPSSFAAPGWNAPPLPTVPPVATKPPVAAPVVSPTAKPPAPATAMPVAKPPAGPPPASVPPPAARPPMPGPAFGGLVPAATPSAQAPLPAVPPAGAASYFVPEDNVPPDAPKDQIRRVAILFSAGQKAKYEQFVKFLDSMALHFTKKPLYLRKVLACELVAAETPQTLYGKIGASGAVGVVGVFNPADEPRLRGIEATLTAANLFYRWLSLDEIQKRSAAVDLLVDLTLLVAG